MSPRIAMTSKFAKKFYQIEKTKLDPFVNDSNDHIFENLLDFKG